MQVALIAGCDIRIAIQLVEITRKLRATDLA